MFARYPNCVFDLFIHCFFYSDGGKVWFLSDFLKACLLEENFKFEKLILKYANIIASHRTETKLIYETNRQNLGILRNLL